MLLHKLVAKAVHLVGIAHLVLGEAYDAAVFGQGLQNALAYPPYGLGYELEAARFVELLCGSQQTHVALVDEVNEAKPLALVLLGH